MGKATGFIEYRRALPLYRPPLERLRDWNEFHQPPPVDELRQQGARCMDCGVPFCHMGSVINGAAAGCPLHNFIPEWNDLVYRGRWREAWERLQATNDFPEFTGRVCPAPCEGSCVLGLNDDPVTIKEIEVAIVDRAFAEGWVRPLPPARRTGHRVAVVGSGPAGLACANNLNRAGHRVTVWERADRIGGLLLYGIPNMKLDKGLVERRVNLLAAEGITFVTNANVTAEQLRADFDAVVLCIGATKPRDLPLAGRELDGIHWAMSFLQANTKSLLDSRHADGNFINVKGQDVIVIGGGDTGTDCVCTALRHGCKSLVQFEILPQPPAARAADNPWPQWPKIHRSDYGQEEAAAVFGADPRVYSVMSQRFLDDGAGRVAGIETVKVELREGKPRPLEGTERFWPAQTVLLALGFTGAESNGLVTELGVKLNARGNLLVDENKQTNVPGLFAAGDAERGQSLVVWAIADGRRAAHNVDKYLRRRDLTVSSNDLECLAA